MTGCGHPPAARRGPPRRRRCRDHDNRRPFVADRGAAGGDHVVGDVDPRGEAEPVRDTGDRASVVAIGRGDEGQGKRRREAGA